MKFFNLMASSANYGLISLSRASRQHHLHRQHHLAELPPRHEIRDPHHQPLGLLDRLEPHHPFSPFDPGLARKLGPDASWAIGSVKRVSKRAKSAQSRSGRSAMSLPKNFIRNRRTIATAPPGLRRQPQSEPQPCV